MALSLTRVGVRIGGRAILNEVSLSLASGRLVALLGPNGAGKTTLLRAAAGLIRSGGDISILGKPLSGVSRAARARMIAYLPQGHQSWWPLTAREIVALGRHPHGMADPARLEGAHLLAVDRAMERTGTARFADRRIETLSGGERARVMLARVLAVEAPVLLADEPTAALDPRHQLEVMADLKAESRHGALVVAVTHDIGLAARMADEIVLMQDGAVVAHGVPPDVLTDRALADVYGVSAHRDTVGGEALILPWGLA
ncbi:MAG: ABC transporter ATP-binding protein [Beijerinckiaceae bacterium]